MAPSQLCCRKPDIAFLDGFAACVSCGEVSALDEIQAISQTSGRSSPSEPNPKPINTETSPYVYLPIKDDDFRLIELQPGDFEDPIVCQIFHGKIKADFYEAVSYTWSDDLYMEQYEWWTDLNLKREDVGYAPFVPQQDREIVVCSTAALGRRIVKATRNCENALRRVRGFSEVKIIWIDALCIDQTNDIERGHQVRKMPDIYANATIVNIYLGETQDESDVLFRELQQLGQGQILPRSENNSTRSWQFLRRRWFRRVWCLQEVAMAKAGKVICGADTITLQRLLDADLTYRRRGFPWLGYGPNFVGSSPLTLQLSMKKTQSLDRFYSLLNAARLSSDATDPRDMVYALYGLLDGAVDAGLEADYTLPLEKVYENMTQFLLERYQSLDFLSQAEQRSSKSLKMASWAIDWSVKSPFHPLQVDLDDVVASRCLSVPHPRSLSLRFENSWSSEERCDKRVLIVQGFAKGRILATDPCTYTINVLGRAERSRAERLRAERSRAKRSRQPNTEMTATRQSVIGLPAKKRSITELATKAWAVPSKIDVELQILLCEWAALLSQEEVPPKELLEYLVRRQWGCDAALWSCVFSTLYDGLFRWPGLKQSNTPHRLFLLEDLSIGVGPASLREGDQAVQLAGATVMHFVRGSQFLGEGFIPPIEALGDRVQEFRKKMWTHRISFDGLQVHEADTRTARPPLWPEFWPEVFEFWESLRLEALERDQAQNEPSEAIWATKLRHRNGNEELGLDGTTIEDEKKLRLQRPPDSNPMEIRLM